MPEPYVAYTPGMVLHFPWVVLAGQQPDTSNPVSNGAEGDHSDGDVGDSGVNSSQNEGTP
jgi:hypothetical protein